MALVSTPIPFDIIDAIIDELHDNRRALKKCSLVGRAFTPQSQKHLFYRVKLSYPSPLESNVPVKEQVALLTPKLARHIRHIRVENYAETSRFQNKTVDDTFLLLVLSRLSKLQSFTLSLNNDSSEEMVSRLSNSLSSALVKMFNSTQVAEVNLHSIEGFPAVRLAYYCPSIRRLNLKYCWGESDPLEYSSGRRSRALPDLSSIPMAEEAGSLEVLHVGQMSWECLNALYDATLRPRSQLTFAHVNEIVVNSGISNALDLVARVVATAGNSLKRFTWDVNEDAHDMYHTFDGFEWKSFPLPPCTRLAFVHDVDDTALHLQWLCAALEKKSRCSELEDIVLVLTILDIPDVLNAAGVWDTCIQELATLNTLLGGEEYSRLRRVAIFVEYISPSMYRHPKPTKDLALGSIPVSYFTGVVEGLRKELPLLDAKGVLSVQWMMTEKQQLGLGVALRALEEGIQGGVHVGGNGQFKIGRQYRENALHKLNLNF